jgi:hypothetical protein
MGNRYLQEVTGIIRKQQGKRGPVWMCGEQLIEMIAADEDATKLVLDDLTHGGMSLEKCEKKIHEFARGHGGCCTGAEGEKIIREYFGLRNRGATKEVQAFVSRWLRTSGSFAQAERNERRQRYERFGSDAGTARSGNPGADTAGKGNDGVLRRGDREAADRSKEHGRTWRLGRLDP